MIHAATTPPLWHYVLPDPTAAGRFVTAVRVPQDERFAALESFPSADAAQAAADLYNGRLVTATAALTGMARLEAAL